MRESERHEAVGRLDVAILCALEVERIAVTRALKLTGKDREFRGGQRYWRGRVTKADGVTYEVAVAQLTDMANPSAVAGTIRAIQTWTPSALLLVGIAGAVSDRAHLGDVVVGTQVIWHEAGKVTDGGVFPEVHVIAADQQLLQAAKTAETWNGATGVSRPDRESRKPRRLFGSILSGEQVVASAMRRDALAAVDRKAAAVEMEGYGFSYAALVAVERPRHLVVKALCDFANGTKDDAWQPYAAAAAASYARHLLLDWPFAPVTTGESEQQRQQRSSPAIASVESTPDSLSTGGEVGHAGAAGASTPANAATGPDPREDGHRGQTFFESSATSDTGAAERRRTNRLRELAERVRHFDDEEEASVIFPIPTARGPIESADSQLLSQCGVLVGGSGTGKTTVMTLMRRRFQVENPSVRPALIPDPPDSTALWAIDDEFDERHQREWPIERWRKVWRVALLWHAITVYGTAKRFERHRSERRSQLNELLDGDEVPIPRRFRDRYLHPYQAIKLLPELMVDRRFSIDSPVWSDVEHHLNDEIEPRDVITTFLDDLDDVADNAPATYQVAHAGLIAQVFKHHHSGFAKVMRAVVASRPSVLERFEQAVWRNRPCVVELRWDNDSLDTYALQRMFGTQADGDFGTSLAAEVGLGVILPAGRKPKSESLSDYLRRHTSGAPRDVDGVIAATLHAASRVAATSQDQIERAIRHAVAGEARAIGQQMLYQATTNCLGFLPDRGPEDTSGTSVRPMQAKIAYYLRCVGAELASGVRFAELAQVAFGYPAADRVIRELCLSRLLGRHVPHDGADVDLRTSGTRSNGAHAGRAKPGEANGVDVSHRTVVEFDGRWGDPSQDGAAAPAMGLNSCLLEVVGQLSLADTAPEVRFQ